jgi:small neutral amino acid transporter SnatA (MarC family)
MRTLWAVLEAWRGGVRRRLAVATLILGAVAVGVFGVLAPPEHCPTPTSAELREAATEAVEWFARNQQADGTWLYLYDVDTASVSADYNVVRHMGVQLSLYQAAAAGIPGAMETAERGLGWATGRVVEGDGWSAVIDGERTPVGATALLVAALAERRIVTNDDQFDELLERLGRFIVAQTKESGAVLAYYDTSSGEPTPGEYSRYYTGEAYWALARLRLLLPDGPWAEVADRIGSYLSTRRDSSEGYWPPLPDHWAAYGLAETVSAEERAGDRPLTDDELAYARRQAGLFGVQVRWVSQQAGPWGVAARGTRVPRGGGYGVIGEALTGLWLVAHADPRLVDVRTPLAERVTCIAGLAMDAQLDESEAGEYREPARVQGAWLIDGETRMDDQQHALSALLRTIPIVQASDDLDGGSGLSAAPSAWLWAVALFAAVNPFRSALALPRGERSARTVTGAAALGGIAGAAVAVGAGFGAGRLLDALDVSDASLRIAAGVVAAVVGIATLVLKPPSPIPALPDLRAALVPVAVPMVASAGLIVLAVSAYADRGAVLVAAALAFAVGTLTVLAAFVRTDGVAGRVLGWAGRLTSAVLVVAAAQLVIDGLFAV